MDLVFSIAFGYVLGSLFLYLLSFILQYFTTGVSPVRVTTMSREEFEEKYGKKDEE
jgi:hypothetical protein